MPDPISGGPKPPLPSLPGVQPNTRVGTGAPTVTGPTVASGQPEDPIRDVMDRTRNGVTPGNLPAYNRSFGGTPNNGGVRSLDLRLDADGAGIRGRRVDNITNGTRERTGGVVLDRGGAAVDAGSRTEVRGNGTNNVRNNTLNVRLGGNGVSGGATHRDTLEVDDGSGNTRRRDRGAEFTVGGGLLGFKADGSTEHHDADGTGGAVRGNVDGQVDANSVRLNANGRVENVTLHGRTDAGGSVTVARDRDGNGALEVRGDGSVTNGGVTWGGNAGVRSNTDGNHGVTLGVSRGETTADGVLNVRGGVDVNVTPTGGAVTVDGRVENNNANRRTDAGGTITATRDGDNRGVEVRGDVRTSAGNVTWSGSGGLRGSTGNTPSGTVTVERGETRDNGSVNVRTTVDADAQGVRLNANGERVTVGGDTRTTDRGVVSVTAVTGGVDVNGEVVRTTEGPDRRTDVTGRAGINVADGEVTGMVGGGVANTHVEGDTTVSTALDATLRGSTRGTVGANVRGGMGRTNSRGRLELRADGDATLGPGRTFSGSGGAEVLRARDSETDSVTWRGGVRTNGGLPTATVARDSQDAVTGRSTTVEWRGDFVAASGTIRAADHVGNDQGGVTERGATLEVDATNRLAAVGVAVVNTNAAGGSSAWAGSVDARLGGNGTTGGAGVGVEHTLAAGDGTAVRGSGRVDVGGGGFGVSGALEETLENNTTHGVAGRVGVGSSGLEGAVARTHNDPTGSRTESLGVDRDGVTAGLSTADANGNTFAGVVGVGRNQILGSIGTVDRGPDGTVNATDARVGVGRTGVDMMLSRAHEWQGRLGAMSLSGAGRVTVNKECVDEGPVTDVEALRDLHRVTYKGTRDLGVGGGAGVRAGVLTAGVSGMAQTGREVIYVTHLPPDAAAKAAANPPAPPDMARPLDLKPYDTLSVRQKGRFTLSADVGAYGVSVGGRLGFEGDTTLSVTRLEGSRVSVTLTPQKVKSVAAEARAVVAMVGVEGSKAHALSQTFEFDLSTAAGQHAYEQALNGEMPSIPVDMTLSRASEAVDAVEKANATLPPGVVLAGLGVEDTRRITRSWSVSWAFLTNEGSNTKAITETRRAVHGNVTTARTATIEHQVSTWFSGIERHGLFSTVSTRTHKENDGSLTTMFQDLLVGWRFDDEKNTAREFNEETLPQLRTALGWPLQELPENKVQERRTMSIELRLTEEMLNNLSRNTQPILAAAKNAAADGMAALGFVRALVAADSAADKAHTVQRFMETMGLKALGTLVRALPREATQVQMQASGYSEALGEGQNVAGRFPEAPKPDDTRKAIMDRFHDVHAALLKVEEALARLARDDVMEPAARDALRGQLEEARTGLNRAVDFAAWTVEERRELHESILNSGWVRDDGLVRALEKAGIDDPG